MKRRDFLKSLPCLGLATAVIPSDAALISSSFIKVKKEEINLRYKNLPNDLVGFKIGLITDIHLGGWMSDEVILNSLNELKNSGCKILLLGGDLIWVPDTPIEFTDNIFSSKYFHKTDRISAEYVFEGLKNLIDQVNFEYGTYSVLGNHDRWSSDNSYQIIQNTKNSKLLLNEHQIIKVGNSLIDLYGSEDYWTGIPKLPKYKYEKNIFSIFLSHNPDYLSYGYHKKNIFFNLGLAGHTHGGQVKLPFFGALTYNVADLRYKEGLVEYNDTKFYTSRGLGFVELPIRINCPSEITVFTLYSY
jgi:predicted MPP superfamily phosphohydrolase